MSTAESDKEDARVSSWHDFVAGCVGGSLGIIVGHPLDTLKVQLQVTGSSTKDIGAREMLSSIREAGWLNGFYRGLSFPLCSYGCLNAIFFGFYGHSMVQYPCTPYPIFNQIMAGGFAGSLSWVSILPFDVVKSRVQSQDLRLTPLELLRYCKKMYAEEGGVRTFFRGGMTTMVRGFPVNAVTLPTYTWCLEYLQTGTVKFS